MSISTYRPRWYPLYGRLVLMVQANMLLDTSLPMSALTPFSNPRAAPTILQPPGGAHRNDDHEQAPSHAKRRKKSPQGVAHDHLDELCQSVAVQPHHS